MRRLRFGFLIGGSVLALAGAVSLAQTPFHTVLRASAVEVAGNEAAVALDWSGPSALARGQVGDYTLNVRNISGQPAQKVVVQLRGPEIGTIRTTSPAAKVVEGVSVWELGTIAPQATVPLKLSIAAERKGDLTCQAWVTFTGGSAMTVAITEPKLQLTVEAPPHAMRGELVPIRYTVTNIGDGVATGVRHAPGSDPSRGDDVPMRSLAPGESLVGTTTVRAVAAGPLAIQASAAAEGGLRTSAEASVLVRAPQLHLEATGPSRLRVGKSGEYKVTVTNRGDAVAPAVVLTEGTSSEVRLSESPVADLAPGESRTITLRSSRPLAGMLTQHFTARTATGDSASTHISTVIEGAAALRMELVDLVDPVEKGENTTYEIRVTNTGTQSDTNLVIQCPLPETLRFVSATGPSGFSVEDLGSCTMVRFGAVRTLSPKNDVVFRVTVRPTSSGDQRFRAQITSDGLTTSVVKEESTRVLGD
jgi:uncharacterized repeat protein (TIGR01451 family)